MKHFSIVAIALLLAVVSWADETKVLPDDPPPGKLLKNYLLKEAQKHFDARREAVGKLKTPDDIAARQKTLKKAFREALGDWPERTPLNAMVVGRIPREGYTVEKVIYESRPQHHVTASFYLPAGKGPFPGVLMPIGHSINGKAADYIQRGAIVLAQHGIAVLTYDPIGQGERRQLLDSAGNAAIKNSTDEHTLVGVGALLVGRNTASYRIWDGIRSLDYLASRPEIDPKRLGCTGCSGGGTETSYLMALDDRIAAAAPSCFLTSLERLFATIGPQDAEQNITGQVALGLDHADYVLLHAPQPTLICAATRDFFDIQGTHDTFQEAKRNYETLGQAERMAIFESDSTHGFPKPQREAVLRWMAKWLQQAKDTDGLKEEDAVLLPDAELLCTKTGQVLDELKGKSAFDLNLQRARELREERQAKKRKPEELVSEVHTLLAVPERMPAATAKERKLVNDPLKATSVLYETEPGIQVVGLHLEHEQATKDRLLIYLNDRGNAAAQESLQRLAGTGRRVLALDLRGWGETSPKAPGKEKTYFGVEFTETYLALHLNRPLLGQRVTDVLAVLANLPDKEVEIIGVGAAGLAALHAAALEPRIKAVTLDGTLASWELAVQQPVSYEQLEHVVPGALAIYDLPELAAAIAPRKLTIRNPVDARQESLSIAQREEIYAAVRTAYAAQQAAEALTIDGGMFAGKPELLQEKGAGEGPAWDAKLGLLTSGEGHIYRRDREGKVSVHRKDTGSNGLLLDREGRLVMCEAVARRVTRIEADGSVKVLADRYEGKRFNQPNDLTIDSQGRLYFSDPCYGDRGQMELLDADGKKVEGVYRIDPDGKLTRVIGREVNRPNGLVATPDDKFLFVADNNNNEVGGARKLWRFALLKDGAVDLKSQTLIHDWKETRGPDGMKLDAAGRLYVAAGLNKPHPPSETQDKPTAGIYVFSPEGKLIDFAPIPRDETTNCAFGGDDFQTLFVTAGGSLWSIRTTTPGQKR